MKKLITLFGGLLLLSIGSMQAQSLLKVDEVVVVNKTTNNVTVQVKTAAKGQLISNRITQSKVSKKAGFVPSFNADKTLLTLNFTKSFNDVELQTLLKYSGIELGGKAFKELYHLLNQ